MFRIRRFLARQDGAVTVDFVVLTAAVIGMVMVIIFPFMSGTTDFAERLAALTATYTPK
ncbi:hypothetical protein [Ruixingdingia sedimenti]|uniref:Pilus assembly protein n=1 Tax=Ruixingdingia sedimenti TaxID=3073604 RepID=A0ABU1F5T2_9RHOB|nr:hypothetical protein [Xinfangfangia sp. LG-4]MDR5651973.1 hypothetical protein [Xinfangfangia sp. LG-4]